VNNWLSHHLARSKAYLGWGFLALALAFLAHSLTQHWSAVTGLRLHRLTLAFAITLGAHLWNGWVWSWVLQSLQQPIQGLWSTPVYLRTNLWKYLPGNVWHFYGRLQALKTRSIATGTAVAGVVLDPLLMAAAALLLGLLDATQYWGLQLVGLTLVLFTLRPRWLNPLIQRLSRSKAKATGTVLVGPAEGLPHYPLKPLMGELGFVLLRSVGFVLAVSALSPVAVMDWPPLISRFSLAWCLGLVIPGAPGGVGVFEAAAVSLLQGPLTAAVVLGAVALYRFISTVAEAAGYGLAVLAQRWSPPVP